ncbi:MAG: tRNA 5-methoxyuridine(34)/uridine 5-oxyacetic acid(34) synthase CmoB [Endozoicomonadaceae bacterium]|nr:tRNA 5-methoxyuridine(34)/uridine 5-oxyacetic acid(34) synthase CmoB [Endozoicomonadaceae bacterium]
MLANDKTNVINPLDFYQELFPLMNDGLMRRWLEVLPQQLKTVLVDTPHGDLDRWLIALNALPSIPVDRVGLNQAKVSLTASKPLNGKVRRWLHRGLKALIPWRKGPFDFFGEVIDSEWRSDWKWTRIAPHLSSLKGRLVLDVGCGSGYHCWRMLGEGARQVIGVDPSRLFLVQFEAFKRYAGNALPVHLLPLRIEDVPERLKVFDTVFSMGVFYHRRSPIDHLLELHGALCSGGELVLETLVIEGGPGEVLMPDERYAMMRNVWFLPSTTTLLLWLRRAGFHHARVVDMARTAVDEQRQTEWMPFNSLSDFLDPDCPEKTVEGYPAPLRAVVIAEA